MDRYEEALEKARVEYEKARKQGYTWLMDLLEGMFPDLRESEDERIRKWIIEEFKLHYDFESKSLNPMVEKALAWLEKQKEYPTNEEMLRTLRAEYEKGVADTIAKYEQKEQKPAEWSEDWREEDVQTRFAFYTYKDDPSVLYLSNVFVEETSRNHGFGTRILRAAEKVAEAIGATTISLKVKQNSPANAWYRKNGYGYVAFEDGYDWLEKNLEYMKPNKQEWSEEDERFFDSVVWHLRNSVNDGDTEHSAGQLEDWLKSLKNRGNSPKSNTNSPSWKPSQAQMRSLNWWKSYSENLASLHEDLEKLMEDQR